MKCIFCKNNSSNSKSVEHIIPESLGNKSQVLQKGIVCDSCNSYFGNKIEKIVLEMSYFKSLRSRIMIENKKGKIPKIPGFTKSKNEVEISFLQDRDRTIEIIYKDEKTLQCLLKDKEVYIPIIPEPPQNSSDVSKFIGKIALEALAKRVSSANDWQNDFVKNDALDELRYFVRFGKSYQLWPYHIRRIDSEFQVKYDPKTDKYNEKLNEYDFLIPDNPTKEGEFIKMDNLYFVMGIMGIEYTINLTNAGLDRYINWLSENQNKSILQMQKAEFHSNLNI